MLTLITGGARSGKSRFAQSLCTAELTVTYVATARAEDEEMRARIQHHRYSRPAGWRTVEEPLAVPELLAECEGTVLLDCITLWLSNLMFSGLDQRAIEERVDALAEHSRGLQLVAVTNEVGSGIVPESPVSREFRDLQGFANQRLAMRADTVYLVCCGIPLCLKGGTQ